MQTFETTTFGKWILVGEHAVLRGYPALAFPLKSRTLNLQFEPGPSPLEVHYQGTRGVDFKLLFLGVLENALERVGRREPPRGRFTLTSELPVGAGLGASAALCGAVARWCVAQGWVDESALYEFACRLEDLFHGESSGVDLAVALSGEGVRFLRPSGRSELRPSWSPKLYLSYCGQRGMTSDCVNKVKAQLLRDPAAAEVRDRQMGQAVAQAERALSEPDGFEFLVEAIDLAHRCFDQWGLCHGELGEHLRFLQSSGASAVKPTGSGGGGYALSLWRAEPPPELKLISASVV